MVHKKKKGKYLRTTYLRPYKEYAIYEMPDGKIVAFRGDKPVWEWDNMKEFKFTRRLLTLL